MSLPPHVRQFDAISEQLRLKEISHTGESGLEASHSEAQNMMFLLGLFFRICTLIQLALIKHAQGNGCVRDIFYVLSTCLYSLFGCQKSNHMELHVDELDAGLLGVTELHANDIFQMRENIQASDGSPEQARAAIHAVLSQRAANPIRQYSPWYKLSTQFGSRSAVSVAPLTPPNNDTFTELQETSGGIKPPPPQEGFP